MRSQISIMAILAVVTAVSGSPVVNKRQQYTVTDIQILNYALTLEHLEATFYREGLQNYTQSDFIAAGFADPFYDNLVEIASDEKEHVSFLTSALGSAAVAECVYDFPVATPSQFVGLASVLEGVGVSAYLGAAASILDKTYLTSAGSILTIEARHSAYLRSALLSSPFPTPFDTPLSLNEVYTLAAPFIVSCPSTNAPLPITAFPALTLATPGPINSGSTITLLTDGYVLAPQLGSHSFIYAAFLDGVAEPVFVTAEPVQGGFEIVVPQGVHGQAYVVLTGCDEFVNDETIAAGPAIVEITN